MGIAPQFTVCELTPQRSRIVRHAVVAATFAFAAVVTTAVHWWPQWQSSTNRSTSGFPLAVEPGSLDIGTIWAVPEFSHGIVVRNVSSETLTVLRSATSCECTAVSPASFVLPPRGTQSLQLAIDLTRSKGQALTPTRHRLESEVSFIFPEGSTQSFQLSGAVAVPIAVTSPRVVFSAPVTLSGGGAERKMGACERFTVWKDPQIDEILVRADESEVTIRELTRLATANSRTYELELQIGRRLGPFDIQVTLFAVTPDRWEFGPFPIHATGTVEADVAWSPDRVILLFTPLDDVLEEEIVVWTRTGAALDSVNVAGAPPFVTATMRATNASSHGIAASSARTVVIRAQRPSVNRSDGLLLLSSKSDQDTQGWELPIPVTVQQVPTDSGAAGGNMTPAKPVKEAPG